MFCTTCGAKLDDDALFCTNCGTRVENSVSDETPTMPLVQPVPEQVTVPEQAAQPEQVAVPVQPIQPEQVMIPQMQPQMQPQIQPQMEQVAAQPKQSKPKKEKPVKTKNPDEKSKKKIWIPIVIGASVLLLLGGAAFWYFTSDIYKRSQAMNKGNDLASQGKYAEAIEAYNEAYSYDENSEETKSALSSAYANLAKDYSSNGDTQSAVDNYLLAKQYALNEDEIVPELIEAYVANAKNNCNKGKYAAAVEDCESIKQLGGDSEVDRILLDAYIGWGNQDYDSAKYGDAIEHYNAANEIDSSNELVIASMVKAYCAQGRIDEEAGDYESALEYYDMAHGLDEEADTPYECLIRLLLRENEVLTAFELVNDRILYGENSDNFKEMKAKMVEGTKYTYSFYASDKSESYFDYDENGNLLSLYCYNGNDLVYSYLYTYNYDGYLQTMIYEGHYDDTTYSETAYDGTEEERMLESNSETFDKDGNKVYISQSQYVDGLEVYNKSVRYNEDGSELNSVESQKEYDSDGRITLFTTNSSYDYGNGVTKSISEETYEYDSKGNAVKEIYTSFDEDHNELYRTERTFELDDHGNEIYLGVQNYNTDSDDPVDYYEYKYVRDYDANGNEIYTVTTYYENGKYVSEVIDEKTYDSMNNMLAEKYTYKANVDGDLEYIEAQTYTEYDQDGNQTRFNYVRRTLPYDLSIPFSEDIDMDEVYEVLIEDYSYEFINSYDEFGNLIYCSYEKMDSEEGYDSSEDYFQYDAVGNAVKDGNGNNKFEYIYVGDVNEL
ncbi:MAG: tetratricopeptide repeat protein [Lachnospiraceae bacterium]|nr:tetratricopeptide repeat protein [Candidatus Merdinaster equi]